jgi:hypothetical protein
MSVVHFRNWYIASVTAVRRHVRSWVQTGSDRHMAKVTRLTQHGHRLRVTAVS